MNTVDLRFPALGATVPRDHGYALYGALSRRLAAAHDAEWLGIHGLEGRLVAPDTLDLRHGALTLRLPADKIGEVLALAGAKLDVAGTKLVLGAPVVQALVPAASLDARLVVIKLTGGAPRPFSAAAFAERFEAEAKRQLDKLGIAGELAILGRRSVTVGGRRVIGHAVRVIGLSAEHSLLLQADGLGGKRRMGCGLFRPVRLKLRAIEEAK